MSEIGDERCVNGLSELTETTHLEEDVVICTLRTTIQRKVDLVTMSTFKTDALEFDQTAWDASSTEIEEITGGCEVQNEIAELSDLKSDEGNVKQDPTEFWF